LLEDDLFNQKKNKKIHNYYKMKILLHFLFLLISTNIFAQEILFEPVFFNQCSGEVASSVEYALTDSSTTYQSKRHSKYLILPKRGIYWLHINTEDFDEVSIKLNLENEMNKDSFYSTKSVQFTHSCQRSCKDLYHKEPERFIGKYNSHYRLCGDIIRNKSMVDLYFNGQSRIVGVFNEDGRPIDTLKKYYNTGALAELTIYNSKSQPQLLLSYYEDGVLKTKFDFVRRTKLINAPSGKEKIKSKIKVSTYHGFGKGVDTLKKYYDSGALRELVVYDFKNKPQLILSYYENGKIKARFNLKAGRGLGFYPSGKSKVKSIYKTSSFSSRSYLRIEAYYENGQLKSKGTYDGRGLEFLYVEEEHKTAGLVGATNFASYQEEGPLELISRGKHSSIDLKSYYKDGQLKLISKGEYGAEGVRGYYENGQLKTKQRPRIRRTYNLDKQLVGRIRKRKRVYSYFELETFLITYTPYYNWTWTTFDSLGKKKRKIIYSPFCDEPSCPFPNGLLDSKLDTDSFYKVLIFEGGKLSQKVKANLEEITLYERKDKKWIAIKSQPKESIYKLMEELGCD
jgi:antitoxin component YwqK of YwqJK toxin-antitoxin module